MPCTNALASLVKGEVLSPEKIRATTGGIVTPPTFPNPHYPLPRTTSLPPLSKGGGLTAQHKHLLCCFLLVIRLPFLFIKLFCLQDGGIASPPSLACTNPPKPALSLASHHVLASLVKGRWIDGKAQALILLLSVCDTPTFFYLSNFSAVKTEGLSLHQPFQTRTIPLAFRRGGARSSRCTNPCCFH